MCAAERTRAWAGQTKPRGSLRWCAPFAVRAYHLSLGLRWPGLGGPPRLLPPCWPSRLLTSTIVHVELPISSSSYVRWLVHTRDQDGALRLTVPRIEETSPHVSIDPSFGSHVPCDGGEEILGVNSTTSAISSRGAVCLPWTLPWHDSPSPASCRSLGS